MLFLLEELWLPGLTGIGQAFSSTWKVLLSLWSINLPRWIQDGKTIFSSPWMLEIFYPLYCFLWMQTNHLPLSKICPFITLQVEPTWTDVTIALRTINILSRRSLNDIKHLQLTARGYKPWFLQLVLFSRCRICTASGQPVLATLLLSPVWKCTTFCTSCLVVPVSIFTSVEFSYLIFLKRHLPINPLSQIICCINGLFPRQWSIRVVCYLVV